MKRTLTALAAVMALNVPAPAALAGDTPWIGEITMVGFTFCPRGWTEANGQLLPIAQNQALFSLLGTTYGGDGRTTMGLPDLRGRVPVHTGTGPGLSPRPMGQKGGAESNTLAANQLPAHTHPASGVTQAIMLPGDSQTPQGNHHAIDTQGQTYHTASGGQNPVAMAANSVAVTVGNNATANSSVNNMQPYTTVRFCIALQGTFPSRN